MNIQTVQNAELEILYQPLSLYLKPISNATITITLPTNVSSSNKSVSNFDVMDKLREMILPDNFCLLKVSKSSIEFLKFDAEVDDRKILKNIIAKLDNRKVRIAGFTEYASVRAVETKGDFPSRHDWDSFFRDAKNMDEMKPGERPDTVFLSGMPIKWFRPRHQENDETIKPSENLFKRIFEKYGTVRCVDIPICDVYRDKMKSSLTGLKHFSFDNDTYFEGYVQFSEYGSFVKCLDEFRGMKLVRKEADKVLAVNIKVTFDKTKHLSENCIKRRKIIRDRLIEKDREKVEEEERKLREEREKREKEKEKLEEMKKAQIIKQRQREERRKQKYIQKITQDESSELTKKIRHEQKKLLKAQRKVESIRLLEALFQRISAKYCIDDLPGPSKGFKGFDLRSKLKSKTSSNDKKSRERSLSISSVSSIESDKKKKKRKNSSSSSSSSEESEDEKKKKPISNGNYPGWCQHPETGEWIPTPNYVYPTPFFAASVTRPYYNPHFRGGYRGRGNYKGRGRYRRRYDDDYYDHDDRRKRYVRSRSRSRSRSYSRSRSRSRSHYRRRRSYSRSSHSRSRSHNKKSKSRSKTPYKRSARSQSPSKTQLVTTLRDGNTKKTPPTTRRNRSKSPNGWSSDEGNKRRRSWSKDTGAITPEKLLRSAREIQLHVQQKLKEQEAEKEKRMKELSGENEEEDGRASVDSSKFQSPKRVEKSSTPDLLTTI